MSNTGFEYEVESLLSFKVKSSKINAALGKCLNGVKDKSEKEILPSILLLASSKTVLLRSFLKIRKSINRIEKYKNIKNASEKNETAMILKSDFRFMELIEFNFITSVCLSSKNN